MRKAAAKNVFCSSRVELDEANQLVWDLVILHPKQPRAGRRVSPSEKVPGRIAMDISIDENRLLTDAEVTAIAQRAAAMIRDGLILDRHDVE